MDIVNDIIIYLESNIEVFQLVLIIISSSVIFYILLRFLRRGLLLKVKTKKQVSNVRVFLTLLKFLFIFFLLIIVVAYFYGDLGDLSFVAGLLTVALGWALQKPISGVVAWLILITRRPFEIGEAAKQTCKESGI